MIGVVLSHYPQYEEEAVDSISQLDRVMVVRDFHSTVNYAENVETYELSDNSLLSKFNFVFENTNIGDWLLFLDGDDKILELPKLQINENTAMIKSGKTMTSYNILSSKLAPTILQKHLDWHITGTLIKNKGISLYGEYSLDKQLMFNVLNWQNEIEWKPYKIYKRIHSQSRTSTQKLEIYKHTREIFQKAYNNSNNDAAQKYAKYNILNNSILSGEKDKSELLKTFFDGYRMPVYNYLLNFAKPSYK